MGLTIPLLLASLLLAAPLVDFGVDGGPSTPGFYDDADTDSTPLPPRHPALAPAVAAPRSEREPVRLPPAGRPATASAGSHLVRPGPRAPPAA